MTRRGFLAPVMASAAMAACAPLMGPEGLDRGVELGPVGWTEGRAAYGPDPRQQLYIRRPKGLTGTAPAVLILRGRAIEKSDEALAATMAEQGLVVLVVGRRTSPVSAYPAYVSDAARAVGWAVDRARALDISADHIGLLGLGAGGLDAQLLAQDRRYLDAVNRGARLKAVAVAAPTSQADATFTHPVAYAAYHGAPRPWRGEASQIPEAIQHLKQELNRGHITGGT